MGVSGAGKTHFGHALAAALAAPFQEGDDLHPPENVARMAAGVPLTDEDRAPWLDRVAGWMAGHRQGWSVVTCSALRRAYRDRLRAAAPEAAFVVLTVPEAVLRARLAHRTGHYMPPTLLPSQLATLEMPQADERALVLDGTNDIAANVARVVAWAGKT